MKLKYYLRGLGIGMLVAALVLILSGNAGGGMSDEAVKRRAAELGMVEKDKSVLQNIEDEQDDGTGGEAASEEADEELETEDSAEAQETDGTAESAGKAVSDAEETSEDNGEASDAPEGGAGEEAGTPENAPAPGQTEGESLAEGTGQKSDEVIDRAEEVAENAPEGQMVTFTVVRGDSSSSVARRAEEAGLVRSASEFDAFLCQNGYDKRISIGSYEIRLGETEKAIADMITRSR